MTEILNNSYYNQQDKRVAALKAEIDRLSASNLIDRETDEHLDMVMTTGTVEDYLEEGKKAVIRAQGDERLENLNRDGMMEPQTWEELQELRSLDPSAYLAAVAQQEEIKGVVAELRTLDTDSTFDVDSPEMDYMRTYEPDAFLKKAKEARDAMKNLLGSPPEDRQ